MGGAMGSGGGGVTGLGGSGVGLGGAFGLGAAGGATMESLTTEGVSDGDSWCAMTGSRTRMAASSSSKPAAKAAAKRLPSGGGLSHWEVIERGIFTAGFLTHRAAAVAGRGAGFTKLSWRAAERGVDLPLAAIPDRMAALDP